MSTSSSVPKTTNPELNPARIVSAHPALFPTQKALCGLHITLERLSLSHVEDLFKVIGGSTNDPMWQYVNVGPFHELEDFRTYMSTLVHDAATVAYYTVILNSNPPRVVGFWGFSILDTVNRVCQFGKAIYSPSLQRSRASTELFYLAANHIFEDLGYRRCAMTCNTLNKATWHTAARFDFTHEGTFRQIKIEKGKNRDTAYFSLLDHEWPLMKSVLEEWLHDTNFDDEGMQRLSVDKIKYKKMGAAEQKTNVLDQTATVTNDVESAKPVHDTTASTLAIARTTEKRPYSRI